MLRLASVALITVLWGCNEVCELEPTPGVVATRGTASGSIDVGTRTVSFATSQSGTSLGGEIDDDGTGATTLTVDASGVFLEAALPDLRALGNGETRTIDVDGSVSNGGSFCNFTGEATLTITRATGSRAPEPQFVTSDFDRSAALALDIAAATCPHLVAHATVELDAESYSAVAHEENCPDLSK